MEETHFAFVLPRGVTDEQGVTHREGTMRLATALDEIAPLRDPRVRANVAYFVIILLSRVITQLGTLGSVSPGVIERMYAGDLNYLQDFYQRINGMELPQIEVVCPHCGQSFTTEVPMLGES
jgi:hypothetical protein